jgi:type VI secretion system protein ImpC
MNIQFTVDNGNPSEKLQGQRPINILLVGNFSGQQLGRAEGNNPEAGFYIFPVDPLDPDKAIGRVNPRAGILVGDEHIELSFACLDDFHPDELYRQQSVFQVMHELKQALGDPARAEQASRVCSQLLGNPVSESSTPAEQGPAAPGNSPPETSSDMFSRLLGQTPGASTPVRAATQRLLEQAVGADVEPDNSRDTGHFIREINTRCEAAMRELLRSPEFRELEANWRSLQWLGEQIEFGEDTILWLVDVGSANPAAWPSGLDRAITGRLAGETVDLVISLHEFSDSSDSLARLHDLMMAGASLHAPVLAAADPRLAGVPGLRTDPRWPAAIDASDVDNCSNKEWKSLRRDPAATGLGLGFPRILLRQPYGRKSDPVEAFEFEELETNPDQEAFFWGNPAIVLTVLWLGQLCEPGHSLQVPDLPMVMYDDGSGQAIKPPSEVYISDSAAEKLMASGITPIIGQRGHTGVRVSSLQSIASPPTPLRN